MGSDSVNGLPSAARPRELYGPLKRPGRACGPTGLVCFCGCVRSVTVFDGGGRSLPRADDAGAWVGEGGGPAMAAGAVRATMWLGAVRAGDRSWGGEGGGLRLDGAADCGCTERRRGGVVQC